MSALRRFFGSIGNYVFELFDEREPARYLLPRRGAEPEPAGRNLQQVTFQELDDEPEAIATDLLSFLAPPPTSTTRRNLT